MAGQISVYTFEDKDGNRDGLFETQSFEEAKQHAQEHNLRVIENIYAWDEAIPVEGADFTGQDEEDEDEDELRCRYADCEYPVAEEDEQVTCPLCRIDLGLPTGLR